ncbi:MAG: hypothetical protein ACK5Y2_04845 [Bdellovibrionales bacterium]
MTTNSRLTFFLLVLGLLAVVIDGVRSHDEGSALKTRRPSAALVSTAQLGSANSRLPAKLEGSNTPPPQGLAPATKSQHTTEQLRAQARRFLLRLYGAQKTFWAQHGRYTTDLLALGLRPSELEIPFKFGFLRSFEPESPLADALLKEDPSRLNSDFFLSELEPARQERYVYSPSVEKLDLSRYASSCRFQCTADEHKFEVLLVYPTSHDQVDIWTASSDQRIDLYK